MEQFMSYELGVWLINNVKTQKAGYQICIFIHNLHLTVFQKIYSLWDRKRENTNSLSPGICGKFESIVL